MAGAMFKLSYKSFFSAKAAKKKIDKQADRRLYGVGQLFRKVIRDVLSRKPKPDPKEGEKRNARGQFVKRATLPAKPGDPMLSPTGKVKRAIFYRVAKQERAVYIGPQTSIVGNVGAVHEFGLKFKGDKYPKRPFLAKSVRITKSILAKHWRNSVR